MPVATGNDRTTVGLGDGDCGGVLFPRARAVQLERVYPCETLTQQPFQSRRLICFGNAFLAPERMVQHDQRVGNLVHSQVQVGSAVRNGPFHRDRRVIARRRNLKRHGRLDIVVIGQRDERLQSYSFDLFSF